MGGRRGYAIPIDLEAVIERYRAGESLAAIARDLGVHPNTLCTRTSRSGLVAERNPHGKAPTMRHAKCSRGHDLTAQGARDAHGCVACRRIRANRSHRKRKVPKPKKLDSMELHLREHARTRAILDLALEREHAPHWEKPWLTRQIEALRA